MVNYNLGKIYTLRTYNDDSLIYVGSTCQPLHKRHCEHKSKYKLFNNGAGNYISVFKIIDCGNVYIELLEDYPCDNKNQLHAREGHWIRKLDCVNMCIPNRTRKEWVTDTGYNDKLKDYHKQWYQTNRERCMHVNKQYNESNKDKIKERRHIYNEQNKEKRKQYYNVNKEMITRKAKQYYNNNREKKREYGKIYYENNKEKRIQYYHDNKEKFEIIRKQKYTCLCGIELRISSRSRHMKTKKHNNMILTVINNTIINMTKEINKFDSDMDDIQKQYNNIYDVNINSI